MNTSISSSRQLMVLLLLAVAVGQSFGRFTFAILLPAVKADLAKTYGLSGFLGSMNVGAYLIGTVLVSVASIRVALHHILKVGLVLSTTGIFVLAGAPNIAMLVVGMVLAGVGGAAIYVPAPAITGAAFPPERRGFAVGLLGAGIGTGIVIATQLTNVVRYFGADDDWREVWWIEGVIALVVSVACITLLRPNGGSPTEAARPRLSALRAVPAWPFLTVTYFCYGFAYILVMSYLTAMLERDAGFGHAHASLVFACIGLFTIPGGILIGRLADRVGRRRVMIGGFAMAATCPLLLYSGREPFVLIGAAMFGLAFSGNVASIAAYVSDHSSPAEFTAAFGAVTIAFGIGQTVGPQLGGYLADHSSSFAATFLLSSAVWACGALSASRLPRPYEPRPAEPRPYDFGR